MLSQGWTHCVIIQQSSKATWLAIGCSMYAKDDQPVTFALDEYAQYLHRAYHVTREFLSHYWGQFCHQ
jgi:hypothetical protein